MSKEKTSGASFGIATVIFLIFLVLKLAEVGQVKDWSWWWVTSPLWLSILFAIAILLLAGIIFLASYLYKRSKYPPGHYKRNLTKFERNMENKYPPKKSNFQQRLDEMKEKQEQAKLKHK